LSRQAREKILIKSANKGDAMKKLMAVTFLLALTATWALAGSEKGSWTGQVSDAKCAPKVNAQCNKKCIEGGQAVVFVNDKDGSVIAVANQDALKEHAGHHVKVDGSMADNKLTVDKVTMVGD
jgi:hypothetical protein